MARDVCLPFFLTGHKFRPLEFQLTGNIEICTRLYCVRCGRTVYTLATVASYSLMAESDELPELPALDPVEKVH